MVDPKTFIRMAQAGSEIAFREIVDMYKTYVYQLVLKYSRDKKDVEKEVKLTFKVMWDSIGYIKADRDDFRAWIKDIVIHVCVLKKYHMEDYIEEEPKVSLLDEREILEDIKRFFQNPFNHPDHVFARVNLLSFLTLEEITLLLMKYMYGSNHTSIAIGLRRPLPLIEKEMKLLERNIILQYRRLKAHDYKKKRKDD